MIFTVTTKQFTFNFSGRAPGGRNKIFACSARECGPPLTFFCNSNTGTRNTLCCLNLPDFIRLQTIERFVRGGGDAAFYQIVLTTCY